MIDVSDFRSLQVAQVAWRQHDATPWATWRSDQGLLKAYWE